MGEDNELELEEFKTKQFVYIRKNLSVLNKQMNMFDIFLKVAIVYMLINLTFIILTYSKTF